MIHLKRSIIRNVHGWLGRKKGQYQYSLIKPQLNATMYV